MPRSGSTLLQRLLMGHKEIASISEPWILLPLLYANKAEGVIAEYSHLNSQKAINDLMTHLPEQEDSYYQCLAAASTSLYAALCKNDETYFLDKTPRYYLIIPEILKLYPDAKFIFLFRIPVDIFASILTTWGKNKFRRLYASHIDLQEGLSRLSEGYQLLQNQAYTVNYETLVEDPETCLKKLCQYLDLPFDKQLVENLELQKMAGRLGDPTGIKEYQQVEKKSVDKWKTVFATRFRQQILKSYISGIDPAVLQTQGYSKHNILGEIGKLDVSCRGFISDVVDVLYYKLAKFFYAHLFLTQTFKWARNKYLS